MELTAETLFGASAGDGLPALIRQARKDIDMDYTTDIDQAAVEAWEKKERSVTLTNAEWMRLTTYILMTTKSRQGEMEAWEKLATEKKDDGTPRYKNAAKNAEYWRELDATLEQIRQKLEP